MATPVTIDPCPSADTEVDTNWRTAFDLTYASDARIQVAVVAPCVGARLYLKASADNGTTWENLSAGGTGPSVSVGIEGDQRGTSLNVHANYRGDVLLSVFVQGGDDATPLVLGNVGALVYVQSESGRIREIGEAADCGCSDYWTDCIDFAGHTTVETWRTERDALVQDFKLLQYPDTTDTTAAHYLDATDLFNDNPALAIQYDPYMYYAYDSQDSYFGGYSTVEQRLILTLPVEVNVIGPYTGDGGFVVIGYYTYGLTEGFSENAYIAIIVRDNAVYMVVQNWSDSSYQTPVLLGAAADWLGQPIQVGATFTTSPTAGDIDVVITKGVPCAASQPVVFDGTITVLDATEPMGIGAYDFLWDNS